MGASKSRVLFYTFYFLHFGCNPYWNHIIIYAILIHHSLTMKDILLLYVQLKQRHEKNTQYILNSISARQLSKWHKGSDSHTEGNNLQFYSRHVLKFSHQQFLLFLYSFSIKIVCKNISKLKGYGIMYVCIDRFLKWNKSFVLRDYNICKRFTP